MKAKRDTALRTHVQETVATFLRRAPLAESSLALSGTGVNGAVQYVVLDALGLEAIDGLAHVDVVSGSTYAYLCYRAIARGELAWEMRDLPGWDAANRQWHDAGLPKVLRYLARWPLRRGPLFRNADLASILAKTVTPSFAAQRLGDLPKNATFWLYDVDQRALTAVDAHGTFAEAALTDLVRCTAAVPALYGHGTLGGRRFVDPVYSPASRELMQELRGRSRNALISNMVMDRTTDRAIWLKPHAFGDGKRMVLADFARFVLNVPNPRITTAFHNAFVLDR